MPDNPAPPHSSSAFSKLLARLKLLVGEDAGPSRPDKSEYYKTRLDRARCADELPPQREDAPRLSGEEEPPAPETSAYLDDEEIELPEFDADAQSRMTGEGVDAQLARFTRMNFNHPAALALFQASVRRWKKADAKNGASGEADGKASGPGEPHDRAVSKSPSMQDALRREVKLKSMPDVALRIQSLLKNPHVTVEEVAEVVGLDPGLSAELLRLVNSAFFSRNLRVLGGRFPTKISSLAQALTMVGENRLAELAMTVALLPLFQNLPPSLVTFESFWTHSVAVGLIARAIGESVAAPDPESLFVAGLIHDIGRLIMYAHMPAQSARILRLSRDKAIPLVAAERETLGWDHAMIGRELLEDWQYPALLIHAASGHHDPKAVEADMETAIVHVADAMANALEMGTSGERTAPKVEPETWDRLGLTPEAVTSLIDRADAELADINSFLGHPALK